MTKIFREVNQYQLIKDELTNQYRVLNTVMVENTDFEGVSLWFDGDDAQIFLDAVDSEFERMVSIAVDGYGEPEFVKDQKIIIKSLDEQKSVDKVKFLGWDVYPHYHYIVDGVEYEAEELKKIEK